MGIKKEKKEAVGRELFLFPWPSVALAHCGIGEWGVRKALPNEGQCRWRAELSGLAPVSLPGCWRALVGGLPCPFRASVPLLTQLPSAAAQAARREHSNSHDSLQWAQLGTARRLPQRDTHACQGMCSSVSRVRVDGIRTAGSLPLSRRKEKQPGNGLRSTGLGLGLGL